jgi:hypothetical protein
LQGASFAGINPFNTRRGFCLLTRNHYPFFNTLVVEKHKKTQQQKNNKTNEKNEIII